MVIDGGIIGEAQSWKIQADLANERLKNLELIVETLIITGKLDRKEFNKVKATLGGKPCRSSGSVSGVRKSRATAAPGAGNTPVKKTTKKGVGSNQEHRAPF